MQAEGAGQENSTLVVALRDWPSGGGDRVVVPRHRVGERKMTKILHAELYRSLGTMLKDFQCSRRLAKRDSSAKKKLEALRHL